MSPDRKKCLLISDFTIDPLRSFLKSDAVEPPVDCSTAPVDQVRQVLKDGAQACWRDRPQFAMVWTMPQKTIHSFSELIFENKNDSAAISNEVKDFARDIKHAAARVKSIIIPSWTLPGYYRGRGILDLRNSVGVCNTLMRMNLQLADELEEVKNAYLLNTERWLALYGSGPDDRMWYLGKIPFSRDVFSMAAREVKTVVRAAGGQVRKLLVLDLDNTLWGGVIGEEGISGLRLGGLDPEGEAFVDFQKQVRALKNRGVILAIASRNDEALALEAIEDHPEMVLKLSDFVAWRIDWEDKASNIAKIAGELNLGLNSVVFIDDSPMERARVAEALPEVFVPDWPAEPTQYPRALHQLDCFDMLSLSGEDMERTRFYREERERKGVREEMPSLEEWLYSLELRLAVEAVNADNLSRAVQLVNKTNQFNLIARRMEEAEFLEFILEKEHTALAFRLRDKFGDYGLIGVCSLVLHGDGVLELKDFLLSCRAMGRGVEKAMLYTAAQYARSHGRNILTGNYVPTGRNGTCANFLEDNAFQRLEGKYRNSDPGGIGLPGYIKLELSQQLFDFEVSR